MKNHKGFAAARRTERMMIFEMIEASIELAVKKGFILLKKAVTALSV